MFLNLERPRYIWGAKWWTNKVPKHNATGDWNEGQPLCFSPVCHPDVVSSIQLALAKRSCWRRIQQVPQPESSTPRCLGYPQGRSATVRGRCTSDGVSGTCGIHRSQAFFYICICTGGAGSCSRRKTRQMENVPSAGAGRHA